MRKRTLATAYAVFCALLLIGGGLACLITSYLAGTMYIVYAGIGLIAGLLIAPVVHEFGHLVFAWTNGMKCVYCKMFCFAFGRKGKKMKFRFVSPFAPDETQVVPMTGKNMSKRAFRYTVGGMVFSGLLWLTLIALACVFTFGSAEVQYLFWGISVYVGYLFLLNVIPLEYAGGKTDALVAHGIMKGLDAERVMISAMSVQGEAYAGKRYGEIAESLYFDVPVLAEDEPLFVLITQLRYRYFIDVEDYDNASLQLNRLAQLQPYLTDMEFQQVCAELVFFHSLKGDKDGAEACGKYCQEFLRRDTATAKRVLATFISSFGEKEQALILKESGLRLLADERIVGERLWEEKLLSKITT